MLYPSVFGHQKSLSVRQKGFFDGKTIQISTNHNKKVVQ
jgi:hypothetical protein